MGAPQYEQAGADVSGSGTPGTIPVWGPTTTTLTDSPLTVSGSNVTGAGAIRATGTTAGAPAFTGSDPDSGMYFPLDNTVRFSTGGQFAVAIDSGQRLLVGLTTSTVASGKVQVSGGFICTASGYGVYQPNDHLVLNAGGGKWVYLKPNDGGVNAVIVKETVCDMSSVPGYGLKLPSTPGATGPGTEQVLDCYQEQGWTPTLAGFGGTAPTVNFANYTRVGRLIFIEVELAPTGGATFSTTWGATTITLPFNAPRSTAIPANRNAASANAVTAGATVNLPTFALLAENLRISGVYAV
jgi:hypothetical protein